MVSFFGLKLGADKKKKQSEKAAEKPQRRKIDQNLLGEGQFFGSELQRPVMINGSRPGTAMSNKSFATNWNHPNIAPFGGGGSSMYGSRPGTAMSSKNLAANFRQPNAPYLNGGSSSMVDLGAPGGKGPRPIGSEGNLNMGWNGSMSNLSAMPTPPIISTDSRPGTPNSPVRKNWVHPLDVHYSRDGALSPAPSSAGPRSPGYAPSLTAPSATPSVANAPRSPLGQFEFNLNPSDAGSRKDSAPAPLSPIKGYPSPPQSVNGSLPPLRTDFKQKTVVNNIRDAHRPGPASLPSPTTSAERTSEEERLYPRPIIQNVAAKRDTLTYNAPRRQSFSMNIDHDTTGLQLGAGEEQDASLPTSPPPRSARRPPPPELKNLPLPPTHTQAHQPLSPGFAPPRPRQTPYEGPLRGPARAPDDFGMGVPETRNFEVRGRTTSNSRDRMYDARDTQDTDPRERTAPESRIPESRLPDSRLNVNNNESRITEIRISESRIPESRLPRGNQPTGYLGPPPSSRRVAPGEGERSYGITPANRRPPPPPVELQRKASEPQLRQPGGWDDRDVQHGSFAMISPRMQPPQPPTPSSLAPEPSVEANWPLPSPLASPTFGTGRPQTPTEKSEGQMSPGPVAPSTPGRRPDFGLRAPTGIADEFRIGFI